MKTHQQQLQLHEEASCGRGAPFTVALYIRKHAIFGRHRPEGLGASHSQKLRESDNVSTVCSSDVYDMSCRFAWGFPSADQKAEPQQTCFGSQQLPIATQRLYQPAKSFGFHSYPTSYVHVMSRCWSVPPVAASNVIAHAFACLQVCMGPSGLRCGSPMHDCRHANA